MDHESIGGRVREAIASLLSTRTQAAVADEVGMTPDAFSRALSGARAFSSLELARVAGLTHREVHWLITGDPDPLQVRFAARHTYDPATGEHHVPGQKADAEVLENVALAYRQAIPWMANEPVTLPARPAEVRRLLGEDFVRTFADRVEQRFRIDVLRIQGLSTDYSLMVDGRRAILLKSEPNWFRSNWSLAHELAHLALGHHAEGGETHRSSQEPPANTFAAELLLPEEEMRALDWSNADEAELAKRVWDWGVSTDALAKRLAALRLPVPAVLVERPEGSTPRLLNRHPDRIPDALEAGALSGVYEPITLRMRQAAERRIPDALVAAHLAGVSEGKLNKATLAWLLEVEPADLLIDEPQQPEAMATDDLIAALGL